MAATADVVALAVPGGVPDVEDIADVATADAALDVVVATAFGA